MRTIIGLSILLWSIVALAISTLGLRHTAALAVVLIGGIIALDMTISMIVRNRGKIRRALGL